MRIASVADVKAQFSAYLKESRQGPVVVTKNGKPAAVLLAVTDEDELERLILAHSPKFQAILDRSRRQIEKTGGIPHDVFWREVASENRNGVATGKHLGKADAINQFNQRSGRLILKARNSIFANINRRKDVWWVDIPRHKLSRAAEEHALQILLYDDRSNQLHHLAVAVNYVRSNYIGPTGRDDKQIVRLELSADPTRLFQDIRPGGPQLPFAQFRKATV